MRSRRRPPAAAADRGTEKVNDAIDKGVVYLKAELKTAVKDTNPNLGNDWTTIPPRLGVLGLMGLTLLECGVPPADEDMKKRWPTSSAMRCLGLPTHIRWPVAPLPRPPRRQARQRCRAQSRPASHGRPDGIGSWTYTCPILTAEEEAGMADFVNAGGATVGACRQAAGRLASFAVVRGPTKQRPHNGSLADGDNSNAQFAVLALWVARRHSVNVQPSLVLVDHCFRQNQLAVGGWDYFTRDGRFKGSMTFAGLLTLAVVHGDNIKAGRAPEKDTAIENGFRFLGSTSARARTERHRRRHDHQGVGLGDLYFLWSLERMAVIYDLKMISGKDWYAWAAPLIVGANGRTAAGPTPFRAGATPASRCWC